MLRKDLRQIFRDPQLYRILFVAPLVQLLGFGHAASTDVRHRRTCAVDHDGGAASRGLLAALSANGAFDVVGRWQREADLVAALDHGRAAAGLVSPPGYGRALAAGRVTV